MKTGTDGEFEEAATQSSMREQGSLSALVAMIVCNVIFLVMLAS